MNRLLHPNLIALILLAVPEMLCAQTIRSIHLNPPGTDDGFEYIEIQHTPNTTLTGVTFLEIDGDGNNSGILNTALSLNTYSTGSNGILLIRDAATVLNPNPDPATNVVVFNFTPDIQNGTGTFLLVTGYNGAVNTDYDPEGDGTLNTNPWTGGAAAVLDAISCNDGTAGDDQYADDFSFPNLPDIAGGAHDGIAKYDGTWYSFDIDGTSANPGPYTVQTIWDVTGTVATGLIGFVLTPGATANPLPIGLDRFDAQPVDHTVVLSFATSNEQNNAYFVIERSSNGYSFTDIGQVKGMGNSTDLTPYSFTDEHPLKGINYYRLRQIDFDGKFSLSKIVKAQMGNAPVLTVYPTCATGSLHVTLEDQPATGAIWNVIDIAGSIRATGNIDDAQSTFTISTAPLSAGTYILQIISGNEVLTNRFQKI